MALSISRKETLEKLREHTGSCDVCKRSYLTIFEFEGDLKTAHRHMERSASKRRDRTPNPDTLQKFLRIKENLNNAVQYGINHLEFDHEE